MRRILGVLAVVAAIPLASAASAEPWYVGGFGGLNYAHDGNVNAAGIDATYDIGFAAGGYVGFFVQENVRLEGELSYRTNDIDDVGGVAIAGEAESLAVMANVLFDFKIESAVEPYVGAGIGFAEVDYTISGLTFDDLVIALQFIGGIGIEIAPATQFTVDYRLFLTDNLGFGGGVGFGDIEYVNSAVVVGLKRSF